MPRKVAPLIFIIAAFVIVTLTTILALLPAHADDLL
jgi:hypothetical protein